MPFTHPAASPTRRADKIATGNATPAWSASAITRPPSARMDPTERSIPPLMMTKVIPAATIAMIALC